MALCCASGCLELNSGGGHSVSVTVPGDFEHIPLGWSAPRLPGLLLLCVCVPCVHEFWQLGFVLDCGFDCLLLCGTVGVVLGGVSWRTAERIPGSRSRRHSTV